MRLHLFVLVASTFNSRQRPPDDHSSSKARGFGYGRRAFQFISIGNGITTSLASGFGG